MGVEQQYHAAQSYGAAGRRGHAGHAATGRAIALAHRDPKFPSDNHLADGAAMVAICLGEYDNARMWLDHARGLDVPELEHANTGGITENGPLYGGAGHVQPTAMIAASADLDGNLQVREDAREAGRALVAHAVALCAWEIPPRLEGWIGGELVGQDRAITPEGRLWLCGVDGPRAVFDAGWGWQSEAPLAHLLQNLLGAPGRELGSRYANYPIGSTSWDGWWRVLATLTGLVPAAASAAQLRESFSEKRLLPEHFGLTAGECDRMLRFVETNGREEAEFVRGLSAGVAYRFDRDVVRLADGRVITVAEKSTGGPKPPVNWTEYEPGEPYRLQCANEYQGATAGDGVGHLEGEDGEWYAVGESADHGNRRETESFRADEVVLHWHCPEDVSVGWQLGALHPDQNGEEPPPPDESPKARLRRRRLGPSRFRLRNRSLRSGGSPRDLLIIDGGEPRKLKVGDSVEVSFEELGQHVAVLQARVGSEVDEAERRMTAR